MKPRPLARLHRVGARRTLLARRARCALISGMLSLGVFRPHWAIHADSRPLGGWHRVEASGRWHLYEFHTVPSYIASNPVRIQRACDDAKVEAPRPPRLKHGDEFEPAAGDAVCASCWRAWEAILAMPTCGSLPWSSYVMDPDPTQRQEAPAEGPRRDHHMEPTAPRPALTCGGGWT